MNAINNEKIVEQIAKDILGIETLETRNSDSLDFHDVSVWSIRQALLEALNHQTSTTGSLRSKTGHPKVIPFFDF